MKVWQSNFDSKLISFSSVIYYDDASWVKILDKLSKKHFLDYKVKALMGPELTMDWFFEQTQNLSLFSEKSHWHILNAEKIPSTVFNKISKEVESLKNNQDSILWFWLPHNSKKKLNLNSMVIDKISYWEIKNCVKWIMNLWKLNYEQLETLWPWEQELTLSQHLQLVEMIGAGLIEGEDASFYFQQQSFEQEKFEIINLLDQKKWKDFIQSFKRQYDRGDHIESLRLVQFIKMHFLKMAKYKENPYALAISQTDKKILNTSKNWQNKEILKLLKTFSHLEILAKAGENPNFILMENFYKY